jgi:hypothetical protein
MRHDVIETIKIQDHGRDFTVELLPDDMGPPWKNDDGVGVVTKWLRKGDKRPGWRVLHVDHGSYRFYDMEATTKKAWADGWGLGEKALVALTTKLGREPKRGDIIHEAVERDFQRLHDWCHDVWCYVTIRVIDDETGDDDYLGGVESDGDYWRACAHEVASGLHPLADVHEAAELGGLHD